MTTMNQTNNQSIPESAIKSKRIKYLVSCNDEVLSESTDPELKISYVDISSVDKTKGLVTFEKLLFENAPSRARRIVRDGDVIISTVRTYLEAIAPINNVPENTIVSTGFAVLRPRQGFSPEYAKYALREADLIDRIVANSEGVSYPAINPSRLVSLSIPFPEFKTQEMIAKYLDSKTTQIDALIAKKQRQIELLKEKRSALITQAVTKGLDPYVKMKDSGVVWLEQVPFNWRFIPIKYILDIPITDGPHETPEFIENGIPFISAEAIKEEHIDFELKRGDISFSDHLKYSKKTKPINGDIFIIKSGATTGNVAMVETDVDFNIWSPLALVRPDQTKMTNKFAFYYFKSSIFRDVIALSWSYGTQQNIGMNIISNLRIPVPPMHEQETIVSYLEVTIPKLETLLGKLGSSIDLLKEYRTSLISEVVTGKLPIGENL